MASKLFLLLSLALVAFTYGQERSPVSLSREEVPEQLQPVPSGEFEPENADEADDEFDKFFTSDADERPKSKPDGSQVGSLYTKQKDSILQEAQKNGEGDIARREVIRPNLYYQYYTYSNWFVNHYRCCPRSQNYGCGVNRKRLGCFRYRVNGVWRWCCPIWPSNLYVVNCNCSKCLVQTSTCFHEGKCNRRYTLRTFYAVCYINNFWTTIHRITRALPTSCYCRANRC